MTGRVPKSSSVTFFRHPRARARLVNFRRPLMSTSATIPPNTPSRSIAGAGPTQYEPGAARHVRPSHLPGLDGIRGLAILMVLADHNFGMPGGALGVDLFFALSGFLITRLLLADRDTPSGYYRRFYVRRALRIAPPFYLTLAIVFATVASLRPHWWVFTFYLANFPLLPNAFFSPVLGHTWSLATEEQFYLVWPAVVRHVRPATLIRVCVVCIALSIGGRLAVPHVVHSLEYARYWFAYAPFSRTDGLFVGASVAALADLNPEWLDRHARRVGGIAAVAVAIVVLLRQLSFSKMSPLMAAIGLPCIAIVFGALIWTGANSGQATWIGRFFNAAWIRRVGKISYALYLAHFPVLAFTDRFSLSSPTAWFAAHLGAAVASYALAELSWRILERPISSLKDRLA
jgi:peptidoglycan/LPS O-acetylase OafA/YrhL